MKSFVSPPPPVRRRFLYAGNFRERTVVDACSGYRREENMYVRSDHS